MASTDILHGLQTESIDRRSTDLDTLSAEEFVRLMNRFDREAAEAVAKAAPGIALAIEQIANRLRGGGRLFYIGAGTSGRLGVLDASECPPTFGVQPELVVGLIAGGDRALRYAVEGAEDDEAAAARDLAEKAFCERDALVAISASGWAPYCVGGLRYARSISALAISMACNAGARMSSEADIALEAPTGAEILSGSTRLKAGTATKMMCNMLTTGVMAQIGKVYGNLMVDLRATNTKLRDRARRIVAAATGLDAGAADALYAAAGEDVKVAVCMYEADVGVDRAREAICAANGSLRQAIQLAKR